MKVLLTQYKLHIIYFVPVIINALFIIYLASRIGSGFLSIHDSSLFITKVDAYKTFGYLWLENNFGSPNFLNFSLGFFPEFISFILFSLGLSIKAINLIFYFVILNVIFYSSFFSFSKILSRLLSKKEDLTLVPSLLGALFYSFNLYMIASWHGGTVDGLFLIYGIAPFLLYRVLLLLFREITLKDSLILSLCVGFTINTFPFALALYLMLFIPYFVMKGKFFTIKHFSLLLLSLLLGILISVAFTVPIFFASILNDPYPLRNGANAYAFSGYGLLGMLRFYFDWTINQSWGGRFFHSYFPYYNSIIVAASAILLWLLLIWSQLGTLSRKNKIINTFLFLGIILSLFLAKGSQVPFGEVNLLLYKYAPLFSIFRTPDTKFGLPVVLFFSVLTALYLTSIKNKYITTLVTFLFLIQTVVFFTALPILERNASYSFDRIVFLPKAYREIATKINTESSEGKVLMYPGISYGTFVFGKNDGLTGQDLLGKIIERPVIYGDLSILGKTELYYANLVKRFDPKVLGENGIRYIVIRDGVNKINTNTIKLNLNKDPAYKKVYTSSLATVFQIDDTFYRSSNIEETKSGGTVRFQKINPTKYIITLDHVRNTDQIVFLSSFHPAWQLYTIGTLSPNCKGIVHQQRFSFSDVLLLFSHPLFTESHTLYSQYANFWNVDSEELKKASQKNDRCFTIEKDGTITGKLILFFTPQAYVVPLFVITSIVTVGVICLLIKKRYE